MENKLDIENTIREHINGVLQISLATVSGYKPWVCEVHFSYDDEMNLYFRSKIDTRHCKEIALNPHVAGTIVEQHRITYKPRGVYFEGEAELLENVTEEHPAYQAVAKRYNFGKEILDDEKKFYKITVTDFYLLDARDSVPGQKHHLKWNTLNKI